MPDEVPPIVWGQPDARTRNDWPRFLDILRAFRLSDAQQDAYFPKLKKEYFYSSIGSDDITRCAYRPVLAKGYTLSVNFHGICAEQDEEMLTRLSAMFFKFYQTIVAPDGFTDTNELRGMRPQLRKICDEALEFFGAEQCAPTLTWAEVAPQ